MGVGEIAVRVGSVNMATSVYGNKPGSKLNDGDGNVKSAHVCPRLNQSLI